MAAEIEEAGGTVEKFVGDAVLSMQRELDEVSVRASRRGSG
jgi:class 3 adenylate cyclase